MAAEVVGLHLQARVEDVAEPVAQGVHREHREHDAEAGEGGAGHSPAPRVIQDVAVALDETGIDRVVVIAGPGLAAGNTVVPFGNFIGKAAVRQLNHEHPGLDAIWVQPLVAASGDLGRIFESEDDVHAGEVEASFMLAPCPSWVRARRRLGPSRPRYSGQGRSGPFRDPRRDEEVEPLIAASLLPGRGRSALD